MKKILMEESKKEEKEKFLNLSIDGYFNNQKKIEIKFGQIYYFY